MNTIAFMLIFSCLFILGSSRLHVAIRVVAIQGVLIGALPVVMSAENLHIGIWILAISGIALKGVLLPALMNSVLLRSGIRTEVEPFVGYSLSIVAGVFMLALSVWLTVRLRISENPSSTMISAIGLYLIFIGMFLMIGRRKAIMQSLAYLVMENGIYAVGLSINLEFPLIVELGVLLDVFVGVFLMGNFLFNIDQEFSHMDADKMMELSDFNAFDAGEDL